ncbi:hypothetical protein CIRG_02742 [Coccidioides immitis RMSCC 2394]|uniref:Uncharacterized protein n=1 Tax=Coccidioides immitis RMSCC 2394 TaxID=404692 RepID=A0A0J6Y5P8_COCIT|nr:hypothetical protein CIRG_02742 [Coccidioides immitis RMSCC 2394]
MTKRLLPVLTAPPATGPVTPPPKPKTAAAFPHQQTVVYRLRRGCIATSVSRHRNGDIEDWKLTVELYVGVESHRKDFGYKQHIAFGKRRLHSGYFG